MTVLAKLELKVPPVVVVLTIGLLMKLSARWDFPLAWAGPLQRDLAYAFSIIGVLIAVTGVVSFRQARTTVDPRDPNKMSALVTRGIYRFTRNPMYLGMLFVLIGWALWLGQTWPWIFLPLFVVYLNRFQIVPEERVLERMFGAAYAAYRAKVRRWI